MGTVRTLPNRPTVGYGRRHCPQSWGYVALAVADGRCDDELASAHEYLSESSAEETPGIDEARTTWDGGRTVGHLGTSNQFGGLTYLTETAAVRPGDLVALCGNGIGFSYGCAVLEVVASPAWAADAGTA